MSQYTPHTQDDIRQMCQTIGIGNISELFSSIPSSVKLDRLDIPDGLTPLEVERTLSSQAAKNKVFDTIFRGAGAYRHYIPPVVKNLAGRSEFLTAYTPYQAEISQGILQIIFEFQSHICRLTGLDVSNASIYDGATAAAEAVKMCLDNKRKVVVVPDNIHPDTLAVIETYLKPLDVQVKKLQVNTGIIDMAALQTLLSEEVACLYFEQINFYGMIENSREIIQAAKTFGIKTILGTNPIALALLPSAGELGATIATGEGQPLGLSIAFGGPYLGYIACVNDALLVRKMPGRIVGETTDTENRRTFVLTLQAREQHIRREKALSSICSNQAHCALTATIYLSHVGKKGLTEIARQCTSKAHYMARELSTIKGFKLKYNHEFFHEFVTVSDIDTATIEKALAEHNLLSGLPLNSSEMLWCCTELSDKSTIDKVVSILKSTVCN